MKLSQSLTVDAFLAWERRQQLRYEFDGDRIVAMTGGTVNHAAIMDNVAYALRRRLKAPCRAFTSNPKILTAGSVRYPDAVVTCSPVAGTSDILPSPVVVFEVLSSSTATATASVDRVTKNEEYRATQSIQRYIMLEQTRIAATVFARAGESWIGMVATGDAVLAMPEIGVELPLMELYADVELPPPDTDD
ncbi:MAG TPA: Uma2 family endonuclease [Acetobacteraceae bacterium]|nr:Uma2 family endonuclease [Acetobacteraceae bacterium]